ncbi:MAG: hypothetical protein P1Q69_04300 [Candidatus Thorarchaeota archaeon]|nr:hypothetical protein [Candidatus Thorarchaeota archaeon]
MNKFFVFMCPKCRNFTNAPTTQKRRRCSYCGTIIDITKAACALVDDQHVAAKAVRAYNAARGGDEFEKAVEKSKERIRDLLPPTKISAQEIASNDREDLPTGKRSRLLSLLEKHAKNEPLDLTKLEEMCGSNQLEWTWVEQQLTTMANGGVLIFPRPWTVKLVRVPDKKEETKTAPRDVSKDIVVLFRREGKSLSIRDIIAHFGDGGIASSSVEASLEKLMRSGEIYEPEPGYLRLV